MKQSILTFLFLLSTQCTPQVFAESPQKSHAPSAGDIDMNQFKGLQEAENKKAENNVQLQVTCTDEHGSLIRKGENGFATCMANSQSRVLKQSPNPEATDESRKR